jgi:integrase
MVITVKNIKRRKNNYFMTQEEVKILWNYVNKWSSKFKLIIAFCLFRGLRIGEVVAININDFNEEFTKLKIIIEKSHICDYLPLPKPLSEMTKDYIIHNATTFKDGFLFPYYSSKRENHLSTKVAEAGFSKLRKEIGLKHPEFLEKVSATRYRISLHSCRRFFETCIYRKIKDKKALADIMRYLDSSTVDRYIDSFEIWRQEREILKETFESKIQNLNRIERGQTQLGEFGI